MSINYRLRAKGLLEFSALTWKVAFLFASSDLQQSILIAGWKATRVQEVQTVSVCGHSDPFPPWKKYTYILVNITLKISILIVLMNRNNNYWGINPQTVCYQCALVNCTVWGGPQLFQEVGTAAMNYLGQRYLPAIAAAVCMQSICCAWDLVCTFPLLYVFNAYFSFA